MAIKPTIRKAALSVADLDRHRYADYALTVARGVTESDGRMMARLVAFALNADERLELSAEIADTDEPSLALKGWDGRYRLWIEVGLPDPKRLRKAASRADEVVLYLYHGRQGRTWLDANRAALEGIRKLRVMELDPAAVKELAALADRTMDFQCTVQDGRAAFAHSAGVVEVGVERLL